MLRRVVALLVAFAAIAERVADRSLPVRFFVLWILRRAETAAADFVFGEAGTPPPAIGSIAAAGNGPDDALRLAARFTALAAALRALLPIDCPFGRRPAPRAFSHVASVSGRCLRGWASGPNDTS